MGRKQIFNFQKMRWGSKTGKYEFWETGIELWGIAEANDKIAWLV